MKNCLILLFLSAALILLTGCGEDTDQRKKVVTQQQSIPNAVSNTVPGVQREIKDSSVWPPPVEEQQDNILPADQWARKNYVMIFDGSGSMQEQRCSGDRIKSQVAEDAVTEWARSIGEDAHLGLVAFDKTGLSIRLHLDEGGQQEFVKKVQAVAPGSGTPLTESVQKAYEILTDQARKQLGYGEYHMVIVTDGAANKPDTLTRAVSAVLRNSPIIISTIGFCISDTHSLNQPGRTVYKAADNPAALRQGLQEVLAESESFDDVTDF